MSLATLAPAARLDRGVLLICATMVVFASQDAITKHLALGYPPPFVVSVRYWAFGLFVLALSAARPGGIRAAARTRRPALQLFRGVLLAAQITVLTDSFARLGIAESHAAMAISPLLVAAGAALWLGERIGRAAWLAIGLGFLGVLLVARPGGGLMGLGALQPLISAAMFASYGLLTRLVGREDPAATSFFYTGLGGALFATLLGPFHLVAVAPADAAWLALLCVTGMTGHFLLIKAYEAAEPGRLQPFVYLQTVLASAYGVLLFDERLAPQTLLGGAIVVAAGLLGLAAARRAARESRARAGAAS